MTPADAGTVAGAVVIVTMAVAVWLAMRGMRW